MPVPITLASLPVPCSTAYPPVIIDMVFDELRQSEPTNSSISAVLGLFDVRVTWPLIGAQKLVPSLNSSFVSSVPKSSKVPVPSLVPLIVPVVSSQPHVMSLQGSPAHAAKEKVVVPEPLALNGDGT